VRHETCTVPVGKKIPLSSTNPQGCDAVVLQPLWFVAERVLALQVPPVCQTGVVLPTEAVHLLDILFYHKGTSCFVTDCQTGVVLPTETVHSLDILFYHKGTSCLLIPFSHK
jgi:hypothetical protein